MARARNAFDFLEYTEAHSIRESEDDEESRTSEVIDMTAEEKDLFSNYMQPVEDTFELNNIFQRRTVSVTSPSL